MLSNQTWWAMAQAFFSRNFWLQLAVLSPALLAGGGLFWWLTGRVRRHKFGSRLLGYVLLISLAAYACFCFILISLPLTQTSFGAVQPILIMFGVIWLLLLDGLLIMGLVALRWRWARQGWPRLALGYGLFQMGFVALLFYAFYIEPHWIEVTHTTVTLANLPANTPPLRMALVSDVHMELWTRRDEATIQTLNTLQPDLIVLAGDYINIDHYEPEAFRDLQRFFGALHAPKGVFAVAGVVDNYDLAAMLQGTAIKLLEDDFATIKLNPGQNLYLAGLRSVSAAIDAPYLRQLGQRVPPDGPKLLLYHTPDLAPEAAAAGFDFYLAGHTHGGQIALPFFGAIFTASKYGRAYSAGLYNLGGPASTRLYVTRGLGLEGANMPRARLFARPEITLLTFQPGPIL